MTAIAAIPSKARDLTAIAVIPSKARDLSNRHHTTNHTDQALMLELTSAADTAVAQAPAYTAAILAALGDRDPFEVLRETPGTLRYAVASIPDAALARPEAPGKWSMRQVLQHLADAELVGASRFRMVLAHDRPELPGYDQDRWAERLRYQEADIGAALDDFALLRRLNLRLLRRATLEDRARVMCHAERGEESLEQMIRLYAGHDLVHLRQLARVRSVVWGKR